MLSQNTWDINALREMWRCTVHLAAYSAAEGHHGATPLRFSRDVQVLFWKAPVGTGWILQSFRAIKPAQHQQKCFLSGEFFSQGTSPFLATPAPSEQGEDGKDGVSSHDPSQVLRWWGGPGGCTMPRSTPGEMFNNIINNVLVVVLRSKQLWGSSKNLAIAGKCNVRQLCAKFVYLHQPAQLHL